MRVELSDEFDRNFERKAIFSDKWKPRAHDYPQRRLPHSCRLFVPKISAYDKNVVKYVCHVGFICYICGIVTSNTFLYAQLNA